MSCCATPTTTQKILCPACGQCCFSASRQTILQQVQFPDNQNIAEGHYAFCFNRDCPCAYFSAQKMIPKASLRVFQPDQETMLCHCFDISESLYRAGLADGTAEAIKAFVVKQTKEGLCACESRNPSGRCCLASFRLMEKAHAC